MNRFKKEIRKKGIKLESDYETLPYYLHGKSCFEPGYILLEGTRVDSETATVFRYLNIGREKNTMNRNGEIVSELL